MLDNVTIEDMLNNKTITKKASAISLGAQRFKLVTGIGREYIRTPM